MLKTLRLLSLISLLTLPSISYANLVTYSGVDFPQGDISFLDQIISYTPGPDVQRNSLYDQPNNLLGAPDGAGVSIGDGGELILRFLDNVLIADGTSAEDLWIFEIGPAVEWFNMEISTNGLDWIFVANIRGQPSGIDIDSVNGVSQTAEYSWLRLTDDITRNNSGFPFGEGDFDAIGAISSRAATPVEPQPVSAPTTLSLFALGLIAGFARRRDHPKKSKD